MMVALTDNVPVLACTRTTKNTQPENVSVVNWVVFQCVKDSAPSCKVAKDTTLLDSIGFAQSSHNINATLAAVGCQL